MCSYIHWTECNLTPIKLKYQQVVGIEVSQNTTSRIVHRIRLQSWTPKKELASESQSCKDLYTLCS